MAINFPARLHSKATEAKLETAQKELHDLAKGDFSGALKELARIVDKETDFVGNSKGHGEIALDAIKERLHLPARNPEQVQTEVGLRLTGSKSKQARQLSKDLLKGKIQIPQRTQAQELALKPGTQNVDSEDDFLTTA